MSKPQLNRIPFWRQLTWQQAVVWVVLNLWLMYFWWLWSHQYGLVNQEIYAGGIAAWADGAAHLTYASRFAYGPVETNQLPIYAGHPFSYPFVADALTGLTTRFLGVPLVISHQLWGFCLSAVLLLVLYGFYKYIFRSRIAAITAVSLFLLAGGAGGIEFFKDIYSQGLGPTVSQIPRQYTHFPDQGIEVINTISGQLLPQRALSLGLIVGCVVVSLCYTLIVAPQLVKPRYFVSLGILLGLLPIIHPHTLIVMAGVVVWTGLLTLGRYRWRWLYAFIPAVVIGVPLLMVFILPSTSQESFISWKPGWLAKDAQLNWIWFWLLNWGAILPLGLWAYLRSNRILQVFFFPIWMFFIAANLITFQPYAWDNTKIFTWIYLILAGFISVFLVKLVRTRRIKWGLLASGSFVILTFSGGLDSWRLLQFEHNQIHMYSTPALELAEYIKQSTPAQALFLTSDLHVHPVPTLTGRQVLLGYRGWLWTYGIDYNARWKEIESIYQGGDQVKSLLEKYQIDYLVIGPHERHTFTVDETYFLTNFTQVYQNQEYIIYQI